MIQSLPNGQANQGQRPAPIIPGYLVLDVLSLPQDGQRFLALALSPTFEIGLLAAESSVSGASEEGHAHYQFINADMALWLTEKLFSALPFLTPHISAECMTSQPGRDMLIRLQNARQAHELTRRRQRRHEEAARDAELRVTVPGPGATCDGWPAVTEAAAIPILAGEPEEEER